jgi:transcriptional regulator with XRE-family HTH domain
MNEPPPSSLDERRRRRLSHAVLTPEQQAAVEARRAYRQTAEYQEDLARDIEAYRREYPPAVDLELLQALAGLRREREGQGLSLTDLAERTGIDRATISKLENGRIPNPTVGTLRTYARALGRRLTWSLEPVRTAEMPSGPRQREKGPKPDHVAASVPNPLYRPSSVGDHRRVVMNAPRFSRDEIYTKLSGLLGKTIKSLTGSSYHRIVRVDPVKEEYQIEYPSSSRMIVRLDDLYALYREIYARGSIDGAYVSKNVQRILGWKTWHAPGRALFAILPLVDDSIRPDGGALRLGV